MAESARQAAVVYANSLPAVHADEPLTVVAHHPVGGCSQVTSASTPRAITSWRLPGCALAIYRR